MIFFFFFYSPLSTPLDNCFLLKLASIKSRFINYNSICQKDQKPECSKQKMGKRLETSLIRLVWTFSFELSSRLLFHLILIDKRFITFFFFFFLTWIWYKYFCKSFIKVPFSYQGWNSQLLNGFRID